MTVPSRIQWLRRKIADLILGKQTVLFTSQRNLDLIEAGRYLELPDEALAAITRRWFLAIEGAHSKAASAEARPVTTMTAQHGVLALARYAMEAKAETAEFNVRGSIDGGRTEQVFSVTFKTLPDDYAFGPAGVEREMAAGDPDRITKLTLTFDNPDYDTWKAEMAAKRSLAA